MSSEITNEHSPSTAFALSSWNYGSFHHCNPYYQKNEFIKSKQSCDINTASKQVDNPPKKTVLKEEDKIVTDDYLKNLNDYKIRKSSQKSLTKTKSVGILRQSSSPQGQNTSDVKNQAPSAHQTYQTNESKIIPNKQVNYKYQLSFQEWAVVKDKQLEIFNKVKKIKEDEDKNFEYFNKKIDENYMVVKNQNFTEWLEKKKTENAMKNKIIKQKEEMKIAEKQKRESEAQERLDMWLKRQAEMLEYEKFIKKKEEEIKKEESTKKQKEEEFKKNEANEAFKIWREKKQQELKNQKPSEMIENQQKGGVKHILPEKKPRFIIGPYSNAKNLKEIQKRITINFKNESERQTSQDFNNKNHSEAGGESQESLAKNEEDSLHELSAIKKETPLPEQYQDYD